MYICTKLVQKIGMYKTTLHQCSRGPIGSKTPSCFDIHILSHCLRTYLKGNTVTGDGQGEIRQVLQARRPHDHPTPCQRQRRIDQFQSIAAVTKRWPARHVLVEALLRGLHPSRRHAPALPLRSAISRLLVLLSMSFLPPQHKIVRATTTKTNQSG